MGEGFLVPEAILEREDGRSGVGQGRDQFREGRVCRGLEANDHEVTGADLKGRGCGFRVDPKVAVGTQDLHALGADGIQIGAKQKVDIVA